MLGQVAELTRLELLDEGRPASFSFEDMLRYHGHGSPAGVAHAFKVLERALPLLGDGALPERREIVVHTAFGGPGARDGFELVTRAVTEGRYTVDAGLARPERGPALERFVFRVAHRDRRVTLIARAGTVPDEMIALARKPDRTPEEEARLAAVKLEAARLVMAAAAPDVYEEA